MKQIFIVLTCTGTVLSYIIKLCTKNEYTHVSIALDEKLDELYSFGRLNPYNPFIGGFVHEGINIGTFKRFKNTKTEIMLLNIEDNNYKGIKRAIKNVAKNKDKHTFNIIGLIFAAFHKKIQPRRSFYCAEFVKYILKKGHVDVSKLPDVIKPEDFKKLEHTSIYVGKLRNYPKHLKQKHMEINVNA